MKEMYIDLMDKVFSAYTDQEIIDYFERTKKTSVSEHGFPRIVANLGILIAHGKREYFKDLFIEMMDFVTADFLVNVEKNGWQTGNEFSVKEIVGCLLEVEKSGVFLKETTDKWRENLKKFNPRENYGIFLEDSPNKDNNWVVFAAVSEQIRKYAGLSDETEYIDNNIATQLNLFDENGMYRDPNEPIVYDLVTRHLFMLILHFGYEGKYKEFIEDKLIKSADLTLYMQSVTGEIPFGGRSAQFIHNETNFAAILEFYAGFFKGKGDLKKAGMFKCAARLAIENAAMRLSGEKIYHVKNFYPNQSLIGCEHYAYFDKYMITAASWMYLAYFVADDTIEEVPCPSRNGNFIEETSDLFHLVFMKFGDWFLELDKNANTHYDSSGIGRIHKKGVPSEICLSVPFAKEPNYRLDIENPSEFSIGVMPGGKYRILDKKVTEDSAFLKAECEKDGNRYIEEITITKDFVEIVSPDSDDIYFPAFLFDGETYTEIVANQNAVSVSYKGHKVTYTSNGKITDLNKEYANRNGHYRAFSAKGNLKIEME